MSVEKKQNYQSPLLFDKKSYVIMGIGLGVIIIGFFLMAGGKSADPMVFNDSEIYSFRRITLAPILIIIGFIIEIYAILRKIEPEKQES